MTKDLTIIEPGVSEYDTGLHGADAVKLGDWYWVTQKTKWKGEWTEDGKDLPKGAEVKWLGCVQQVGSNFVELKSPPCRDHGYSSLRIHFDDFDKMLAFAPDADKYIAEQQAKYQQQINTLLGEVKEITKRLGVVPTQMIAEDSDAPAEGEGQNALVMVTAQVDTTAYKKALVRASEKTLPTLFEDIKKASQELARWMTAPTLPLMASVGPMKASIGAIKERIYTIELYAGLTEEAVKCCDGEPAGFTEKLCVMQRRLYMDEECLANYTAGGMEIKDIKKFDSWISKPENRDRILPFPRTLVAFRVRRLEKQREHGGNLWNMHINFQLADADKKTFLYVRNGEQVWRVDCDFEFDEAIVPNREQFDPSEPMMMKMFCDSIKEMMPRKRWESLVAEEEENYRKYKEWEAANPGENNWIENPFHNSIGFRHEYKNEWKPFDQTNVYFDDAMKTVAAEIKRYNRIAVIIQGLFDRSEALHPHPPVKVWEPESFERSVELMYDAVTLTHGDKPDFEAYRAKLNASLDKDSIVVGQDEFWMLAMAKKENEREANDWRNRNRQRGDYIRYRPEGDPGPGYIGPMTDWKARARKAAFRWKRKLQSYARYGEQVPASIDVPASALLNVSAYTPGDYKQFFYDPRTRRDYLQWAPLLLAAEDYLAGKAKKHEQRTEREY